MMSDYPIATRRLVLVDSVGFSYVEIPLDEHAILLAVGNVGKSSILNSLRLFLLPEVNLRKSEIKFGFRKPKTDGFYTNRQSFDHYFPSNRSFLILEVDNASGTHCQILYRGDVGNLGYKRLFVPVPYEDLRGLFWDTRDPDGIGFARPDLSVRRVVERTKEMSRKATQASDKKTIANLIYSNDILSKDASRFAVLPMPSVDDQKIETLRTLVKMLFEVGGSDRSMALAVANIIESQKNYERDRFDFDIEHFLNEREHLDATEKHLNKVVGRRSAFEQLRDHFEQYNPGALADEFRLWYRSLQEALSASDASIKTMGAEVADLESRRRHARNDYNEQDKALSGVEAILRRDKKKLDDYEARIFNGDRLLAGYPNMSLQEARECIADEKVEVERDLDALRNSHIEAQKKQELTRDIEGLHERIKSVDARIQNSHLELKHQITDDQFSVLSSVNRRLAEAGPGRPLSESERAGIAHFCELFERRASVIRWFDIDLPLANSGGQSLDQTRKDLQRELRDKESQLRQLESASSNPEEKAKQIRTKEAEVKRYVADLEVLDKFEGASAQRREIASEIKDNEVEKERLGEVVEGARRKRDQALGELNTCQSKLEASKKRRDGFSRLLGDLQSVEMVLPKLSVRQNGSGDPEKLLEPDELVASGIVSIQVRCREMEGLREQILASLKDFLGTRVLSEDHAELRETRPSQECIRHAWADLKDLYANLDHQLSTLEDQRRTHNELVENYRTSLRKNRDFINNVQAQLNRNLENVEINDLAEIKVDVECDEAFESLVRQSERINVHTTRSLSDAFYDQLKAFMERFFTDEGDGQKHYRLTMEKVVKKISYRVRKEGYKDFEEKSQSHSSTALINLSLVQSLLRGILDQGYEYTLPAVLDEVASVDISQIDGLLDRIRQAGFRLFSASTHSASNNLVFKISRNYNLDEMRTAKPYHESRTLVFWGGPEGNTEGAVDGFVYPEQRSLMDMDMDDVEPGKEELNVE